MADIRLKSITMECLEFYKTSMDRIFSLNINGVSNDQLNEIHIQMKNRTLRSFRTHENDFQQSLFQQYSQKLSVSVLQFVSGLQLIDHQFNSFQRRNNDLRTSGSPSEALAHNTRVRPTMTSDRDGPAAQTTATDNIDFELIGNVVAGVASVAAAAFIGFKYFGSRDNN